MHRRGLCGEDEGCALRLGRGAALAVVALLFLGCKPQLGSFLPANAHFARTFGQLFEEGGNPRLSHFVVVKVPPAVIRTVSSGTIEYRPDWAGMGNCVLVRPQTYPISLNDFSGLQGLPSPSAIVLAYCHLVEASVREAARTLYMRALPAESASEWDAAAAHFIARDEGFTQLDVRNIESPMPVSDELGRAVGDELYFAVFRDEGAGKEVFVNPLPYLAAAVPAASLDAVVPTIAEVVVQTSASGFLANDIVTHAVVGGAIATPLPRHPMRIAIRSNERAAAAGAVTVPYVYRSRLELLTGTPAVRSRGAARFNSFSAAQGQDLAGRVFGLAAPIESDPALERYYALVAWNNSFPAPDAGEDSFNALTLPGSFVLDLNRIAGGAAAFPGGQYRLTLTVGDVAQAAPEQAITFQLEPGVEMQILQDGNPDDDNFVGDTPVDAVRIALWDRSLDSGNNLLNGPDPLNFVARDRWRFYVSIRDPGADTDPGSAQTIHARLGTLSDATSAVVDDLTDLELTETAVGSGVFVSRAQILTSTLMNPAATPCAAGEIMCEDDLFWAHDGRSGGGLVNDDAPGDRTHRAGLADHVRINYQPVGAVHEQDWNVPVCQRNPDARRKVSLRVTVLDHVVDADRVADEIERANIGWAPACLEFEQTEPTRFHDAPLLPSGDSILDDNDFSTFDLDNPGADSDEKRVIVAYRDQATAEVVEVFFVHYMSDVDAGGKADAPHSNVAGLGEKTFLFVRSGADPGLRILAHELGHALENGDRDEPPNGFSDFYPSGPSLSDSRLTFNRRISAETVTLATRVRTGARTNPGNRLMHPY